MLIVIVTNSGLDGQFPGTSQHEHQWKGLSLGGDKEQFTPMKMMLGCNLQASENMALTSFWLSPNHLDMIELARMFTNMPPDSFASACSNDTRLSCSCTSIYSRL